MEYPCTHTRLQKFWQSFGCRVPIQEEKTETGRWKAKKLSHFGNIM